MPCTGTVSMRVGGLVNRSYPYLENHGWDLVSQVISTLTGAKSSYKYRYLNITVEWARYSCPTILAPNRKQLYLEDDGT